MENFIKSEDKKFLISKLLETGCLEFGEFKLKSGVKSDHYVDLREISMVPELFKTISNLIIHILDLDKEKSSKRAIVGVPYGVVPLAAFVAGICQIPYYPVRKEVKPYGKRPNENKLNDHEYIIIEDVMSTGSSILETIDKMSDKKITDVLVIVDRELGGEANIKNHHPDIKFHSILRSSDIVKEYSNHNV